MDGYLWLKALHVAAVMTWVGGMVASGLALAHAALIPSESPWLEGMIRWDRRVTAPAMGIAWILGILMASLAGWFSAPWLMVKLGFVVALSALHGMVAGRLRRASSAEFGEAPVFLRHAAPVTLGCAALIAALVIIKPF